MSAKKKRWKSASTKVYLYYCNSGDLSNCGIELERDISAFYEMVYYEIKIILNLNERVKCFMKWYGTKLNWVQNLEPQKVFVFVWKISFKALTKFCPDFSMNDSEWNEAKRQFMLKRP